MEGSNFWGYGYKTQHSYPRSRLITWRRSEVKFGWNVVKKKQHKNYLDEDKKSVINKERINSQIKKPHLKMLPIKDNFHYIFTILWFIFCKSKFFLERARWIEILPQKNPMDRNSSSEESDGLKFIEEFNGSYEDA